MQRVIFIYVLLLFSVSGFGSNSTDTCLVRRDSVLSLVIAAAPTNPALAAELCRRGIKKSQWCHDSISLIEFKTRLGRSLTMTSDYTTALTELIESQKLARKIGDKRGEAFSVMSQGNVFFFHKLYGEAHRYYLSSLDLAKESGDSDLMGAAYHNVGLTFFNAYQEYDSANIYLNKALLIFESLHDTAHFYFTLYNIGSNYYDQGNYVRASENLERAKCENGKYLGWAFFGDALIMLGDIYSQQNNFILAEKSMIQGLSLVKQNNMVYYVEKGYNYLSKLYQRKGNYNKAFEYSSRALELKDSLERKDIANKIAILKIKYDLDLKEQEIKLLTAEKNLTQEKLKKGRIIQSITVLILVLILIITFMGIKQYRIQKKFNERLKKQVEQKTHELSVALERAEKSDKLKSIFLQNMSHEVRTPLNAIHGFSELLAEDTSISDLHKEFTSSIIRSSNNLIELFDNITLISRLETNDYQFNFKRFNLMPFLNELTEKFIPRNQQKHHGSVEFKSEIDISENDFFMYSDPENLYRVLYNLLDNALKFTTTGSILFKIQKQSGFYLFSIIDTGIGIPEEYHHQIFEKFRKFNVLDNKFNRGAGLGLPISKLIVENISGEIWFKSLSGKGSSFFVKIPADKN
jgi:signal transduction histidine kinase